MKPVSGGARVVAALVAISATFSIVWSMANLGYPGNAETTSIELAAVPYDYELAR